ncbi:MAG: response regulator transcription factor [Candidatus Gracilibacteria bacterium]|nr:response regulator transcription factor [Candidatus Gracilibacteria bacterium]
MKKILIVEDDKGILAGLKLYMKSMDFDIETLETGEGASEKILSGDYDLVTLDINLPGENGIEICKEVRKFSNIPIIMLTARTDELDKVLGLEIGADDYITKPFSPRELIARINSILRRVENNNGNNNNDTKKLNYAGFEIDIEKMTLHNDKKEEIMLTKSEFNIFKSLVEAGGRVVSRNTLMKEIIGYEQYIFDRTIDTHIKNLRKKLDNKELIVTVRGEGYRIK